MNKIIIDTSIIIDHTRANKGILLKVISSGAQIYIPMVVISELWAGSSMNDRNNENKIEKLIERFIEVDLSKESAKNTGKLLRDNRLLGTIDAIIAATALEIGACVATSNKKHFSKINGLKLYS